MLGLKTPAVNAQPSIFPYTTDFLRGVLDDADAQTARATLHAASIYDSRDYANLTAAVAAIAALGNPDCELHIWQVETLTAAITFPPNITVVIHDGGMIDCDDGGDGPFVPTFHGAFITGIYTVFDISCAPIFQRAELLEIYPHWWGQVGLGDNSDDTLEFQAAINAMASAKNGAKLKIPPCGWGHNSNYYRFTDTLTIPVVFSARSYRIEGSGMGSYMHWDVTDKVGLYIKNGDYTKASNQFSMRGVYIGLKAGSTKNGIVMELIRQGIIEDCAVLGAGDNCWSIEGCFNLTFLTCFVGGNFGSPGNVAVQGTWNVGWNVTDDPNNNTGSNVNVWVGGKTKGGTVGMLIDDTSYQNSVINHSFAAQANDSVRLDSTFGSPTWQVFDNCEFEDTAYDVNDVGTQPSLSQYHTGGTWVKNAGAIAFNYDYNAGTFRFGPNADGYVEMRHPNYNGTGSDARITILGDPTNENIDITPLGTGDIQIGGASHHIGIGTDGIATYTGTGSLGAAIASDLTVANGGSANFNLAIDSANTTVNIVGAGNTRDRDLDYYNTTTHLWSAGIAPTDGGGTLGTEYYIGETKGGANASLFITPTTSFTGIKDNSPAALLDVGGGTATTIDGTDDLLVADDVEIDGNLYVEGAFDESANAVLTVGGQQSHVRGDQDRLTVYAGSGGEIAGEASLSLLEYHSIPINLTAVYDEAIANSKDPNIPLFRVHPDKFPYGITFVEVNVLMTADPVQEPDIDLCWATLDGTYWRDMNTDTVIVACDTTEGVFTEEDKVDLNNGTAVAASKGIFLRINADPDDEGIWSVIEVVYYAEAD